MGIRTLIQLPDMLIVTEDSISCTLFKGSYRNG